MEYTIGDLTERACVSARTVREYIARGMMAPPHGLGLAATYDEEQLLRAVVIARLRARKESLAAIAERIRGWKVRQLRAFVAQTDPPPEAPSSPEPVAALPDAIDGEPVRRADLQSRRGGAGEAIPGPRWALVSLLPGMALLVRDDAAPIVQNAAREIIDRYAGR